MAFTDLQSFLKLLEKEGELHRVTEEVDAELEVTEIATRAVKENLPALLFENVKGSKYPLVINSMASMRRIELALGRPAEALGEDIVRFMEDVNPPNLGAFWRNRKTGWRLLKIRPKNTRRAMVQQVVEEPRLDQLPILKCWPEDGGRFFTLPLVMSRDPQTGAGNMGMYRMQMYDQRTTGMHMQIQKGGGFHYQKAEKLGQPLEMAVAVGGDPALILAAIMPVVQKPYTAAGLLPGLTAITLLGMAIGLGRRAIRMGAKVGFKDKFFAAIHAFFANEEDVRTVILFTLVGVYIFFILELNFVFRIDAFGLHRAVGSFELYTVIFLAGILKYFWKSSLKNCLLVAVGWTFALTAIFVHGFSIPMPGML